MWWAEVYPAIAGIVMGVLAAIVTFFPPAKPVTKGLWCALFVVLGGTAAVAVFYTQHLAHEADLEQQRKDSERDQRLEYMKGQLDAVVLLGTGRHMGCRAE